MTTSCCSCNEIPKLKKSIARYTEIERDNKHLLNKMKNILTGGEKFTVQDKNLNSNYSNVYTPQIGRLRKIHCTLDSDEESQKGLLERTTIF